MNTLTRKEIEALTEGDLVILEPVFEMDLDTSLELKVVKVTEWETDSADPDAIAREVAVEAYYYGVYFGSGVYLIEGDRIEWWARTGGTLNGTKKPTRECVRTGLPVVDPIKSINIEEEL